MKILNWLTSHWKTKDWLINLGCNILILLFWILNDFCHYHQTLHNDLGPIVLTMVMVYSTPLIYTCFRAFTNKGKEICYQHRFLFCAIMYMQPSRISFSSNVSFYVTCWSDYLILLIVPSNSWAEICNNTQKHRSSDMFLLVLVLFQCQTLSLNL
jgi:hypothetical protein